MAVLAARLQDSRLAAHVHTSTCTALPDLQSTLQTHEPAKVLQMRQVQAPAHLWLCSAVLVQSLKDKLMAL